MAHCKKVKIWNILCLQASNLAAKTVVRPASPCTIIVVLLSTKCAVRRQMKPGITWLIIKRGQSNFSSEEKGYYRVVSVGQLSFDYRTYCGFSHRMQGSTHVKIGVWPKFGLQALFMAGQAWRTPQPLQIKSFDIALWSPSKHFYSV